MPRTKPRQLAAVSESFPVPKKPLINVLRPRTPNQQQLMEAIERNHITVGLGPAGCGKTKISVGMAAKYFMDESNPIEKIIITRPVKEAGESIGFLPGALEDKLHPYLIPIYDEMATVFDREKLNELMKEKVSQIEIVPLSFMRGRNFHRCVVVADEMQNATHEQIYLLVSRLGEDSKIILNGDLAQSDLPHSLRGGLEDFCDDYGDIEGIRVVRLNKGDIVRHPLVGKIVDRKEEIEGDYNAAL